MFLQLAARHFPGISFPVKKNSSICKNIIEVYINPEDIFYQKSVFYRIVMGNIRRKGLIHNLINLGLKRPDELTCLHQVILYFVKD